MTNVVVLESDIQRDRKACITLFHRVAGANQELAQWLIDHPKYTHETVAEWLSCSPSRIGYLRDWAKKGFPGESYRAMSNRSAERDRGGESPLKSHDNSDDEVE